MTDAACPLCHEFVEGSQDSDYRRVHPTGPETRVLLETPNLLAIVDLSPLSLGHSLILPKAHHLNFAQVAHAHYDEVQTVTERLTKAVLDLAGRVVVLEHGSSSDMDGGACIAHAHWHVVGTDLDAVRSQMERDGLTRVDIDLAELASNHDADVPYFLVGDGSTFSAFGINQRMPRQYLRAVAANTLGLTPDTHDWAVVQRRALFQDSFTGLAARL